MNKNAQEKILPAFFYIYFKQTRTNSNDLDRCSWNFYDLLLWSFFLDSLYDVSVGRYVRAVGWLVDHLGEREEVLVVPPGSLGEGSTGVRCWDLHRVSWHLDHTRSVRLRRLLLLLLLAVAAVAVVLLLLPPQAQIVEEDNHDDQESARSKADSVEQLEMYSPRFRAVPRIHYWNLGCRCRFAHGKESQARDEGGKLVGGLWQSKALVQVQPKALSSPS